MKNTELKLVPVNVDEDYSKKWNLHLMNDFMILLKNGLPINTSLYREGGFKIDLNADYFLILKYHEGYYKDEITKIAADKPHLDGRWAIYDKNGTEKIVFKSFESPYLQGGLIYSLNNGYHNIETGESYIDFSTNSMHTDKYIFVDDSYNKDKNKRGILRINKFNGKTKLYPKTV